MADFLGDTACDMKWPWSALVVLAFISAVGTSLAAGATDEGWVIESFDAQIEIQSDGRLQIEERIDVDFGPLERHGIYRDIPVVYDWPHEKRKQRVYELDVLSVTDARRRAIRYESSRSGANAQIKIGDPGRTITGRQTYVISYTVRGVLNAFSEHDELYWNVTGGEWPVPILKASATVRAPAALAQTTCYVGPLGSTERCASMRSLARGAVFTAGKVLVPGEQLTVVGSLPKGVVAEPRPLLQDRPREFAEFFELTAGWLAAAALVAVGGLGVLVWKWWSAGRDDPERVTIVPEYEPPDGLRPAQVGLIVDERADTLDVTATIVDLAVRGYLTITEIPKEGLLGKRDWLLTRVRQADDVLGYERTIFDGLFDTEEVRLSALKKRFYVTLSRAQSELYGDAVERKWFPLDPSRVRVTYAVAGVGLVVVAGIVAAAFGYLAGGGLMGIGALVPAVAVVATSGAMPRKTRDGAELARRALGFKRYMDVAETDRQRFAEKEQIFAEYLPFAIVFGCVDRWARAFEGIDLKQATSGWYHGSSLASFSAMDMSRDLSSFSSQVSSSIASTPGSSSSSGFSGGGSGGGGGGGGGGSW